VGGTHVQGVDEVALAVNQADDLARPLGDPELQPVLGDVGGRARFVEEGPGRGGGDLRPPGGGEGVVEDRLQRRRIGRPGAADGDGPGGRRQASAPATSDTPAA
jgi:hypothetical protein